MRSYDTLTLAALTDRSGVIARQLLWIVAKNRSTGLDEQFGLWNGEDNEIITIGGQARTYYGAGSSLVIPSILTEIGIQVRTLRVKLSPISPEVGTVLRTYDPRFAPVQVHRALYDLNTRNIVSEPKRVFKGFINKVDLPTPAVDGEAECTLSLVSTARVLTNKLALKKSDESQKLRAGDRIRRYADVSNKVTSYWGENKP